MEDKKKLGGRKSNTVEYSEKLTEALELILYKRLTSGEFRATFSKMYGVSERTADATWKRCKDIIAERFKEEQGVLIEQQIERYFDLLNRAREDKNKRVERETLDSITKLYGLEGPKKVDITSAGEPIKINLNFE
jgi:hypothetical protein